MPAITVKLYSVLAAHLSPGSRENRMDLDVADGASVAGVIGSLSLPEKSCHLVLLNGLFVAIDQRASAVVRDGDTLAIWPPVAGG